MTAVFLRFVSIKYGGKDVSLEQEPLVMPEHPLVLGRSHIAKWLGCSEQSLPAVSEEQILIKYRESSGPHGGFYICNLGLNILFFNKKKVSDGRDQAGHLITGRAEVTVRARNDAHELIQITLETNTNQATQPITDPNWSHLTKAIKSDRRIIHIYGLPGTGKSYLVNRLTSLDAPWPETRRRDELADFWTLRIDGRDIIAGEEQPWFEMCYAILSAMRAESSGNLESVISQSISLLSKAISRDATALLSRPFDTARRSGVKILLILENFDEVYKQIDWRMVSWLTTVQKNYKNVGLVLVTRRSLLFLDQYRSDPQQTKEKIEEFRHLFAQNKDYHLPLSCWPFDLFRARIVDLLIGVPLSADAQKHLWQLTGGHPLLSVEVCNYLRERDLLTSPQNWLDSLKSLPPESPIYQCFEKIWQFLSANERLAVQKQIAGKPLTGREKQALIQVDILTSSNGDLFTPLFAHYVSQFDTPHTGLQERNGQLFLDDQEITLGYKAEPVVRHLLNHANSFCAEEELVKLFYSDVDYEGAAQALKKLIQRQNKEWQGEFVVYHKNFGYKLVPNPKRS